MQWSVILGYFFSGVLNNSIWVLMNSSAKDMKVDAVGLVFVCNILPTIFVKSIGPTLVFHRISYGSRAWLCGLLMLLSLFAVAFGDAKTQVLGIVFCSLGSGLGESSLLASTAFSDSPKYAIAAWASGTGIAGIMGVGWRIVLMNFFGLNFQQMLLLATIFAFAWVANFFILVSPFLLEQKHIVSPDLTEIISGDCYQEIEPSLDLSTATSKLQFVALNLWPFMIPFFVVYFSEYVLLSGVFAVVGFPVESISARDDFYVYASWVYQFGVLVSRSSGLLYKPTCKLIWAISFFQFFFLIMFTLNGFTHTIWDWSLLCFVFVVGLNGGFVYVWTYHLVSEAFTDTRAIEFSLAVTGVSGSCGIIFAAACGVLIQGCLEGYNNVEYGDGVSALFECGFSGTS
jgi:battenin